MKAGFSLLYPNKINYVELLKSLFKQITKKNDFDYNQLYI